MDISTAIDSASPAAHNGPEVELTVVEKLIIIRRRRNLDVANAARRWRVSPHTLSAWEQKRRNPSKDMDVRLRKIIRDEEAKGW